MKPSAEVLAELEKDVQAAPPTDKLELIRDKIREARDLELQITDMENVVKQLSGEKRNLIFDILPTMFMEIGLKRLDIDAQGNLPAYEAKLTDHFHAVIQSSWPPDRRNAALQWLHQQKLADMIKTTITIEFGLGQSKILKQVLSALKKLKVVPVVEETVPWATLTAMVKERWKQGNPLSDADLTTLGASVNKIVKLNPTKEK